MGNKRRVEPGGTDPRRLGRMRVGTTLRDRLVRLATVVLLGCVLGVGPLLPGALGSGSAGPRSAVVIALDGGSSQGDSGQPARAGSGITDLEFDPAVPSAAILGAVRN